MLDKRDAPRVRTYVTYKCGMCNRLSDPSLEGLAAHWSVDHGINVRVVRPSTKKG